MSRAFSKILILVILVVFVAGGIFAWQYFGVAKETTEDKTVGWKVYKNEAYKYEIKYPSHLEIPEIAKKQFERVGTSSETVRMIFWIFPPEEVSDIYKSISVTAIPNPEKESLQAVISGEETSFCEIETEQSTFIKVNCDMADEGLRMIISGFSKIGRDYIYTISLEISSFSEDLAGKDFSSEINTYDLMVSTFKITEGEPVAPSKAMSFKDLKVATDMSQIQTAAEIYYRENGNYMNFQNTEDVKNLIDEIINETNKGPGCMVSNYQYCCDTTLSDGKTRYCIDSEGRRGDNLGCSSTKLTCITY